MIKLPIVDALFVAGLLLVIGFIIGFIVEDPHKMDFEQLADEDQERIDALEKELNHEK